MFAVTAIGVGIDTKVSVWETFELAHKEMHNLIDDFLMRDFEEMCINCIKGFSNKAQCDVEIQIHAVTLQKEHKKNYAFMSISKSDIVKWNDLLQETEIDFEKLGINFTPFTCIQKWETKFDNGYTAELYIRTNSRDDFSIFCEMVLFDEDGRTIDCSDSCFVEIDNSWHLYDGDDEYVIMITPS